MLDYDYDNEPSKEMSADNLNKRVRLIGFPSHSGKISVSQRLRPTELRCR